MSSSSPGAVAPPKPPDKPDPEECCNRGCCPCIFDYYWDAHSRWEKAVRELGYEPAELLAQAAAGTVKLAP